MSTAIISDIHGNAVALRAVLEDIDTRDDIRRIVCLGDIIGYGPSPLECVDLVADRCEWSLMGNHDFGVLYEPTNFNPGAESAAYWTREQFDAEEDESARARRYGFLGTLRVRVVEKANGSSRPLLAVHGSPRRPINEYIFPDDVVSAPNKMTAIFDRIEQRCFVGHTHVTGIFTDEPDFYPPADLGGAYQWTEGEKVVVNPGSVGQPRDRDPRASYAIMDEQQIEFIRLEYDVQAVVEKVKAIDELSDFLGQRLLEGR